MPISFYILGFVAALTAAGAMSLRNLVHCALCLALSFISIAGLFLALNAPFIAFAQVLVYVGAVAILIVFAILLTRNSESAEERRSTGPWVGLGLAVLLGAVLTTAVAGSGISAIRQAAAAPLVTDLGRALMTSHVIPLELIGLLLTISLLGAVVLALPEKAEEEREEEENQ
jgi:NADH-quinone oxidoreductase subunit J